MPEDREIIKSEDLETIKSEDWETMKPEDWETLKPEGLENDNPPGIPCTRRIRVSRRLAILAAAMVLVTGAVVLGAASWAGWKRLYSWGWKNGESILMQTEGTENLGNISGTAMDHGITVSATQVISDKFNTQVTLKIQGYDLPDGDQPTFEKWAVRIGDLEWAELSDDQKPESLPPGDIKVYGEFLHTFTSDGEKTKIRYQDKKGDLELVFRISLQNAQDAGLFDGETLWIDLMNLYGIRKSDEGRDSQYKLISRETGTGHWLLAIPLESSSRIRMGKPDIPLGEADGVLTHLHLSPISVSMEYRIPKISWFSDLYDATIAPGILAETLKSPQYLLHDGSILGTGYVTIRWQMLDDQEGLRVISILFDQTIQPEQVEAVRFLKYASRNKAEEERTADDYITVPLQGST